MSGADACCETGADTETAADWRTEGGWCSVHSASVQLLPPCGSSPLVSFSEAHTLQVLQVLVVAAAAASAAEFSAQMSDSVCAVSC